MKRLSLAQTGVGSAVRICRVDTGQSPGALTFCPPQRRRESARDTACNLKVAIDMFARKSASTERFSNVAGGFEIPSSDRDWHECDRLSVLANDMVRSEDELTTGGLANRWIAHRMPVHSLLLGQSQPGVHHASNNACLAWRLEAPHQAP